jgi:hypothetical protein
MGMDFTLCGMQREAQLALHLPQVVPHEELVFAQVYCLHSEPDKTASELECRV